MRISTSIEIIDSAGSNRGVDFARDFSGDVTFQDFAEFVRQSVIRISYDALKEEQQKGRFLKPSILVDNQKKPIEQVNYFGEVLIAERLSTADILTPVYENILIRSPKGQSGTYAAFNIILLNDVEIARTMTELQNWIKANPAGLKTGDKIRFLNLTPYASKLERNNIVAGGGKGIRTVHTRSKRPIHKGIQVRVPNGAYVLAHRASQRYLKGNVKSKFEFINGRYINAAPKPRQTVGPNNGAIRDLRVTFSNRAKNVFGNKIKGFYVYPSILLTVTEDSI